MKTERSKIPPLVLALAALALAPWTAAAASFTYTGSMLQARAAYTATLLPNGKVLVAGGYTNNANDPSDIFSSAELYDPASGTWTATGSLNTAREYHTATLLPNGKVLVAGGHRPLRALSSAELYDPATGTWTVTGSLNTAREYYTKTLLPNGKVLVAGGLEEDPFTFIRLSSAELYDPATGAWTATGSFNTARTSAMATLLPNGKVLLAGGYGDNGILASAELYDPATGTWAATGGLNEPRSGGTATLLPNGQVLVVSGINNTTNPVYIPSAELYDPAKGTWTETGSLIGIAGPMATVLPSGKVLGVTYVNSSFDAELYDPATGTWTLQTASLNFYGPGTLLTNGNVLVAGGGGREIIYHPDSDGRVPSLTLLYHGNYTMSFYWNGVGTLQQADSLLAPNWQPAPTQDNPHTISTTDPMMFYRVKAN